MIAGSVKTAMRTREYARLARAPMPRQRDSARTPTAKRIVSTSRGGPRSKSWKAYCSPVGRLLGERHDDAVARHHLGRLRRRRAAAPPPRRGRPGPLSSSTSASWQPSTSLAARADRLHLGGAALDVDARTADLQVAVGPEQRRARRASRARAGRRAAAISTLSCRGAGPRDGRSPWLCPAPTISPRRARRGRGPPRARRTGPRATRARPARDAPRSAPMPHAVTAWTRTSRVNGPDEAHPARVRRHRRTARRAARTRRRPPARRRTRRGRSGPRSGGGRAACGSAATAATSGGSDHQARPPSRPACRPPAARRAAGRPGSGPSTTAPGETRVAPPTAKPGPEQPGPGEEGGVGGEGGVDEGVEAGLATGWGAAARSSSPPRRRRATKATRKTSGGDGQQPREHGAGDRGARRAPWRAGRPPRSRRGPSRPRWPGAATKRRQQHGPAEHPRHRRVGRACRRRGSRRRRPRRRTPAKNRAIGGGHGEVALAVGDPVGVGAVAGDRVTDAVARAATSTTPRSP